jgi:hypothetical protein
MPAALSGECPPTCWDLAIVDGDQRAQLRSSLRADLEDMAAVFEAVALRTRSTAPVPAVKDVATVDELLATWKEMFRGVCAMVLQCKHDLTDDWSPAKIGTELVNSRNSPAQHDPLPRSLFGIELAAKRCPPKVDLNLVEGAERRVSLVEDQMVNLKELFQTQWGMCRQLKQDLATIQSDLDAAKRDVSTANYEGTHLLSQVTIEVCGERDALKQQLEWQASKLEQALMDMLQVEKDLESANKANASLTTQLDELTRLRTEQRADSMQQLARTTLQQQLDAACNERDRLKKLLLQMQSPRKLNTSDSTGKHWDACDVKLRQPSEVTKSTVRQWRDDDARVVVLGSKEHIIQGDASTSKEAVQLRERLRQLATELVAECQVCHATVQDEYRSISRMFERYESKFEPEQKKNLCVDRQVLSPSKQEGLNVTSAFESPTERSILDTVELQVQKAWHVVEQKEGALEEARGRARSAICRSAYLQKHADELEALVQELRKKLETVTLDRDSLMTELTISEQKSQQLLDALGLEHAGTTAALTKEMHDKIKNLQDINKTLEIEYSSLKKKLDKVDADFHGVQRAAEDQRIRARTQEIRLEKLNHRCAELLQELDAAEGVLRTLHDGLVEERRQDGLVECLRLSEERRQEVDRLQQQVQVLQAESVKNEAYIRNAHQREKTEILDFWKQQVDQIVGPALDIEATHTDLVAKFNHSQDELDSLKSKMCKQEQTISDQEQEISCLVASWTSAEGLLLDIAASVDAVQRLEESLQICIASKGNSQKIQEISAAPLLKKNVIIAIVLDMNLEQIQNKQRAFMDFVADDVAHAVQGDRSKVHVVSLTRGSILVRMELENGICSNIDTLDVAKELRNQVSDPSSALRQGMFTCKTKSVKILGRRISYQCIACGDITSQAEFECGMCGRLFMSEAEAEEHQNGCDAAKVKAREHKAVCDSVDTIVLTVDKIEANVVDFCDLLRENIAKLNARNTGLENELMQSKQDRKQYETTLQDTASAVGKGEQQLRDISKHIASLDLHASQQHNSDRTVQEEVEEHQLTAMNNSQTWCSVESKSSIERDVTIVRGDNGVLGLAFSRKSDDIPEPYTITQLMPGGAAARSGKLLLGERIVKVDGTLVAPLLAGELKDLIRGSAGTSVTLTLGSTHTDWRTELRDDEVCQPSPGLTRAGMAQEPADLPCAHFHTSWGAAQGASVALDATAAAEGTSPNVSVQGAVALSIALLCHLKKLRPEFDCIATCLKTEMERSMTVSAQRDMMERSMTVIAETLEKEVEQRNALEGRNGRIFMLENSCMDTLSVSELRGNETKPDAVEWSIQSPDGNLQLKCLSEDLMCAMNDLILDLKNEREARIAAREECERLRQDCRLLEKAAIESPQGMAVFRPNEDAGESPASNQQRQQIAELERQVRHAQSTESRLRAELLETQAGCERLQQLLLQSSTGGGNSDSPQVKHLTEDLMCTINDLNKEREARIAAREECERIRQDCRLLEKATTEVHAQLIRFMNDSAKEIELIQSSFPKCTEPIAEGHWFNLRQVRFEVGVSRIADASAAAHVPADHGALGELVLDVIGDLRKLHGSMYTAIIDYQGRYGKQLEAANEREHRARIALKFAENQCSALDAQVRILGEELTEARDDNEEMNVKLLASAEREQGLQRDVYALGVSLQKEMALRHALEQKLLENASDAADASIDVALELDKREQDLIMAFTERDAARAALAKHGNDVDARIHALTDTVERLQRDLTSLREREKHTADLYARECATRTELATRLQQTSTALELLEENIKDNDNMRSYLAVELKKEQENTLNVLREQQSLQSELEARARESAHLQTTLDDLSADNIAYSKRISDLEYQLIHARDVKIASLDERLRSMRGGLSPAGAKVADQSHRIVTLRAAAEDPTKLKHNASNTAGEHLKEENPRSQEQVLAGRERVDRAGLPHSSGESAKDIGKGDRGRERGRFASSVFSRERSPSTSPSFSPPRRRDDAASAPAANGRAANGHGGALRLPSDTRLPSNTVRGTVAYTMAGRRGRTIFEA